MLNVPNPEAPTIQRWKEVITTINNEANRSRLKIPVLYGIVRFMALATPRCMIPSTNRNAATFNTETAKEDQKFQLMKQRLSTSCQSGACFV
jgi:beta-glucosidase